MNQLKRTGLIEAVKEGMSVKYSLNKENAVALRLLLNLVERAEIKHV